MNYSVDGLILYYTTKFILINGCAFGWSPLLSGVLQSSILGPLLFILYINDLLSLMKTFADNITVYRSLMSVADLIVFLDFILHMANKAKSI